MTTQPPIQLGLLRTDFVWQQAFDSWVATPYGAHIMRHIYREAARYGNRYKATGRQVSMKLIFEIVRDKLPWIKAALERRGIHPTKTMGFSLNNCFSAYAARHLENHRPEFKGLFELRECGKKPLVEKITVTRTRILQEV